LGAQIVRDRLCPTKTHMTPEWFRMRLCCCCRGKSECVFTKWQWCENGVY
jgi:hypothetical protein